MIKNRKQFSAWVIGLLALSLAGCSEAEVPSATTPGDDPLVNDPTRREIILGFQNKLNIKTAGTTRADAPIATTEENEITSLDIYVFSSDKEEGPYTYQERFCYRSDGSTIPNATKIILTVEGDNVALATLRPKKGLFTKFYCIANQPKLLKAGAEYTNFVALEQSSPGADYNIVTKAGIPTETDFLTFTTPLLDPTEDTDILLTPLPMVGSYSPALDLRDISMGSRTRINMTLSRIVSRFDIINDEKLSHLTITGVSMGNPHAITYIDDVKGLDIEKIGPKFESHPAFPDRVNTEFVKVLDDHTVEMRVWERGSGETLACGTGACAVAVASILNGYVKEEEVTVKLLGGDLKIYWDREENLVYMTGPAAVVFDGEIEL